MAEIINIESFGQKENNFDRMVDDRIDKLNLAVMDSQSPESTILIDRSISHLNFLKDILDELPQDYYGLEIFGNPQSSGNTDVYLKVLDNGQSRLIYSQDYNLKAGSFVEPDLFKNKDDLRDFVYRQIGGFEDERKRKMSLKENLKDSKDIIYSESEKKAA